MKEKKVVNCNVLYCHLFINPRTTWVLMKIQIGRDRLKASIEDYFSHTRTALHCYPDDSFAQLRAYQGGYICIELCVQEPKDNLDRFIITHCLDTCTPAQRLSSWANDSVSLKQKDFFVLCFRVIHCWPRLLLDLRCFWIRPSVYSIYPRRKVTAFSSKLERALSWHKHWKRRRYRTAIIIQVNVGSRNEAEIFLTNWEWLIADRTILCDLVT